MPRPPIAAGGLTLGGEMPDEEDMKRAEAAAREAVRDAEAKRAVEQAKARREN